MAIGGSIGEQSLEDPNAIDADLQRMFAPPAAVPNTPAPPVQFAPPAQVPMSVPADAELPYPEAAPVQAPAPPVSTDPDLQQMFQAPGGGTAPTDPDLQRMFAQPTSTPSRDFGELFTGGVRRNWQQMLAAAPTWRALQAEIAGDLPARDAAMREAIELENAGGHAQWQLQNVEGLSDFAYWMVEKFGENAITMLAAAGTGGAGAIMGRGLATGLGFSTQAARAALMRGGLTESAALAGTRQAIINRTAGTALAGGATYLEAPGTAQEQYQVTGSTNPYASIGAGAVKGMLEAYTPMRILNALTRPGRQLGASIAGGIVSTGIREGMTEFMQEAIDIGLRQYSDPNYEFFGAGPFFMGEGAWRLAEATVAGTVLGGVMGGAGSALEKYQEHSRGPAPGSTTVIPPLDPSAGRGPTGGPPAAPGSPPAEPLPLGGPAAQSALPGTAAPVGAAAQGALEGIGAPAESAIQQASVRIQTRPVEQAQPTEQPLPTPTHPGSDAIHMIQPQMPEDVSFTTHTNTMGQTNVDIMRGGKKIGNAYVRSIRESFDGPPVALQMGRIIIDDEHQRLGIATALQEKLEKELGAPFTPDSMLSNDAYQRWLQLDPEAVAEYTQVGATPDLGWHLPILAQPQLNTPRMQRVRAAIAANQYSQEVSRGAPGPVTQVRNMMMPRVSIDANVVQSTPANPREDLLGVMPTLRTLPQTQRELMLDMLEANTERYVRVREDTGQPLAVLLNGTDVETNLAVYSKPHAPGKIFRIDQTSLQAVGITAHIYDMPEVTSNRLYVQHGTTEQEKAELFRSYAGLYMEMANLREEGLLNSRMYTIHSAALYAKYAKLITAGLRVIPSRGSSFYYNLGMIRMEEVKNPVKTLRSRQIAFMDENGLLELPVTGQTEDVLLKDVGDGRGFEDKIPISIDLNKFAPGEVSGVPVLIPGGLGLANTVEYRKGLSETEKAGLFHDLLELTRSELAATATQVSVTPSWTRDGLDKLKGLMRRGVWVKPDHESSALITLNKLTADKFTFGVNRHRIDRASPGSVENTQTAVQANTKTVWKFKAPQHDTSVVYGTLTSPFAREVRDLAQKYAPLVDGLLTSLGIEGRPWIYVPDFDYVPPVGGVSSSAHAEDGAITLHPKSIFNYGGAINPEVTTFQHLMHELGHLVFHHYYQNMPEEQHGIMRAAYYKALLLGHIDMYGATDAVSALGSPGSHPSPVEYYLTYQEWLATQFERWFRGTMQRDLKTELEANFQDLARDMERYYEAWERIRGPGIVASITNSDHYFSMVMEYFLGYGDAKNKAKLYLQQQMLHAVPTDLLENPTLTMMIREWQTALKGMEHMLPKDAVKLLFGEQLDPGLAPVDPGGIARAVKVKNQVIMEFIVGSLQDKVDYAKARTRISHELIHAYSMLGLITNQELEILYQAARREGKKLSAGDIQAVKAQVDRAGAQLGWDAQTVLQEYDLALREETVAQYVESIANGGVALGQEVQGIVARILQVLEKLRNQFFKLGYQTRDDVIRAIFRGDIAGREARTEQQELMDGLVRNAIDPAMFIKEGFDEVKQIGNVWVGAQYKEMVGGKKNTAKVIGYYYFHREPKTRADPPIAFMLLANRGRKGFEVELTESQAFMMLDFMKLYAEKDLGKPLWPSGVLSNPAYMIAKRAYPEQMKYYMRVPNVNRLTGQIESWWWSPITIRNAVATWERMAKKYKNSTTEQGVKNYEAAQRKLSQLYPIEKRIDKNIWTKDKHLLNQMFMIDKKLKHDGVKGSMYATGLRTEEAQVVDILGVSQPPGSNVDPYLLHEQERDRFLQSEAARRLGIEFDQAAGPQPETRYMRRLVDRLYGNAPIYPAAVNELAPMRYKEEADRIGKFSKMYWSLGQLLSRNSHIEGLRRYREAVEAFVRTVSGWHADADEVAKQWLVDIPTPERREVFAQTLFWLTEQQYNASLGGSNPVNRHPLYQEYQARLQSQNFTPKEVAMLAKLYTHPFEEAQGIYPKSIFSKFLDAVEQVSYQNIMRSISDPALRQQAVGELNIEMNKLREKPYFPMSRFGKFTLTVKVPNQNQSGMVTVWHSAYDHYYQLEGAVPHLRQQIPHGEIHIGRVPEEMIEFMGLPGPLIKLIRQMPGLSATQQVWLEEFERNHTPDRTFRKRWLPQTGMQGHSMDAHRTFSHYFMNGSRYLARLTHNHEMTGAIESVRGTLRQLSNNAKRTQILDYMVAHHKYITEPGKDFAKFKAFIGVWQLGYSPAAAFMNLTQIPTVTASYLSGIFGVGQGNMQIMKSMKAAKNIRAQGKPTNGQGGYEAARQEAIDAGRIDIGLASELGAHSESSNLKALLAGTKAQKWMQNVPYYGMWMFQKAEQINREITFHAAWELAKANPQHPKLQQISREYNNALTDLESRLSTPVRRFTREDAQAYWFAKDAVDETQGIYAPHGRPRFLRNPYGNVVLIFFQYVQLMTFVFRYNPGVVQLALVYLALYGMMGLPGAEDLNEVLKAVGQRLFGKDWDVFKTARKYARDLTKGTVLDETGPDLLLHGISRYGFGLGLLPEGYGAPRFDASANGSLGKVVPGLYEAMHGLATRQDYDQYITDIVQRLAGAGYGYTFNLTRWGMEGGGSVDSHTWERALPRAARSIARAYRFAPPETGLPALGPLAPRGAETTRSGAKIVRFNINDPDDMASVITQSLGFSPTRVNETWEMLREQRDTFQVLKARRTALYAQFDYAMQAGRPDLRNDVLQGIRDFNEDVRREAPSMVIQPAQLQQSLRNRARARALQEQLLPTQRSQIPVARSIQEQYPGVKVQQVR